MDIQKLKIICKKDNEIIKEIETDHIEELSNFAEHIKE